MEQKTKRLAVAIGGEAIRFLNLHIALNAALAKSDDTRYIAVDTDAATLMCAWAPHRLQIGEKRTFGLGTNGDASLGRRAAEESRAELSDLFVGAEKACLFTGLQGGTGPGATPVICACAAAAGLNTTLIAMTDGNEPTEKETSLLAEWRTLADKLRIIPYARTR